MIEDKQFRKIKNLKWLPWVGSCFNSIQPENKLLIVGESHYQNDTQDSAERNNSPSFTREIIKEFAIERSYCGTKIFPNLHKAMFRNDNFNSENLWNLVSFYNFIQRPMKTKKDRPTYDDYYNAWFPFLDIIKVLKPKMCLFIGTSAANSFNCAIKNSRFSSDGVKWENFISNAYAKTALLKDKIGNITRLLFIRHTSQMFSWSKWNDFLQKEIPNELKWLSEHVE